MTNITLLKQIARDEAIGEFLIETIKDFKAGMISIEEAQLRLDIAKKMEADNHCEEQDSPFDNATDAEADYMEGR